MYFGSSPNEIPGGSWPGNSAFERNIPHKKFDLANYFSVLEIQGNSDSLILEKNMNTTQFATISARLQYFSL
jgi:hypothetical protein